MGLMWAWPTAGQSTERLVVSPNAPGSPFPWYPPPPPGSQPLPPPPGANVAQQLPPAQPVHPYSPWPPPPPQKPRPPKPDAVDFGTTRRANWAAVVAAGLTGLAFDVAAHNGFVTVSGVALVVVGAVGLIWSVPLRTRTALVLVGSAAVLAVALALRASPWVIGPVALAITALALLAASFAVAPAMRATFPALAGRLLVASCQVVLAPGVLRPEPVSADVGFETEVARREKAVAIARGVGLAVPVLWIIGLLLSKADPVFESWIDLSRVFPHVFLITVGGWGLLGLYRAAHSVEPALKLPPAPRLGTTEALCVFGGLSALYAAFVASQLVSLAGGSDHVLRSQGLTYAEYARHGFFQLLWAAAITLVVLLCVRACSDLSGVSMLVLSEVLVALTLTVVISALVRLQMYESAYGLTLLRLACTVTAAWIGLVFVIVGVSVARLAKPVDWLAPVVFASAVLFIAGWAVANPAGIVASTNLHRATQGRELDVEAMAALGPDAVPAIVAGTPSLTAADAAALQQAMCAEPSPSASGAAYNGSKARAHDLLLTYCEDVGFEPGG